MGSLNVLHLLAPAPFGGLESVVRALAGGHRARGHRVAVAAIVRAEPHPFLDALRDDGIDAHAIVVAGRDYAGERAQVGALLARLGAGWLHTHGYRPDVVDAGVARALGIPVVTTVHGFTGGDWRNRFYEWLQKRAYRRFDAVVAVSRPIQELLARSGVPASRLHLIPNAFDAGRAAPERARARAALGIGGPEFRLGWVGRLTHEKGADVLVEALARVPSVALSVVGDGADRPVLEARASALGLADRVTWHGRLPDAGRLAGAFDLFVLSSRTEGTPIVLFEAIAAGVPVVATAVGGVPDVVGPGEAWLVPPENPAALASAIEEARRDPAEAARRAAAARRKLERDFGLAPWLDRYEELYRSLRRAASGQLQQG